MPTSLDSARIPGAGGFFPSPLFYGRGLSDCAWMVPSAVKVDVRVQSWMIPRVAFFNLPEAGCADLEDWKK